MLKKITTTSLIGGFLLLSNFIGAEPPDFSNSQLNTPGVQRVLALPAPADNSSVISLGQALDPGTGQLVEGFAIIHYKGANAKPVKPPRGGNQCYTFFSRGAKWKIVEPWLVNPSNTRGLLGDFVFNNLSVDIDKWEDAADGIIGNNEGFDILGSGSQTSEILVADEVSPDNKNEVYFANVDSPGAIAITIVWGIFGGPIGQRQLVEWDQVYDDADYDWSSAGEADKMDFENIATHELGHSVGLGDLYDATCSQETMYGYADYGEIIKRDLNTGDIAGIGVLY